MSYLSCTCSTDKAMDFLSDSSSLLAPSSTSIRLKTCSANRANCSVSFSLESLSPWITWWWRDECYHNNLIINVTHSLAASAYYFVWHVRPCANEWMLGWVSESLLNPTRQWIQFVLENDVNSKLYVWCFVGGVGMRSAQLPNMHMVRKKRIHIL